MPQRMSMSLGKKISSLIALPLIAFIIMISLATSQKFDRKNTAATLGQNSKLFLALSELIHQTQKERGKTSLYLNEKISKSELDSQRQITDQKRALCTEASSREKLKESLQNQVSGILPTFESIRADVSAGHTVGTILPQYSQLIAKLIGLQVTIARSESLDGIESVLLSLTILESAKESIGKMRATISGILATDKPINSEQMSLLESLKAGLFLNINSPTLILSNTGSEEISKFKESAQLKKLLSISNMIFNKATVGKFGEDAPTFFETATVAIENLSGIVRQEILNSIEHIDQTRISATRTFYIMITLAFVLVGLLVTVAWVAVKDLTHQLSAIAQNVKGASEEVTAASAHLSQTSNILSTSTQEQAAAIEKTAASLTEISAAVDGNVKDTEAVSNTAKKVHLAAEHTSSVTVKLSNAMSSILESNIRIEQLVKVIEEIGVKTKVIDDIVFQTRLLSFNASVEAERAGEHGRGFAVVAQEMGNLAQMSGKASTEISAIVKQSVKEVTVVSQENDIRVRNGEQTSIEIGAQMKTVVELVNSIVSATSKVNTASREQAKAIAQISAAIDDINLITQENVSAAAESAADSEELSGQADMLLNLVGQLQQIVTGTTINTTS